jgi:hypothetical protein
MSDTDLKLDALYTIFEKHLYDFEDDEESEKAFIGKIVNDYMNFLVTTGVVVPARWRAQITEELYDQVHRMLIKKMYGALSIKEFVLNSKDRHEKRQLSRKKYTKLVG